MKKIILLSLLTLSLTAQTQKRARIGNSFSSTEKLQSAPVNTLYTFSTFTAAYQPITGTSISNGTKWDDPSYSVPMGFDFKLYNSHATTINFLEGTHATFNNANVTTITLMSPMFEDLCDRAFTANDNEGDPGGISDISYTVTGTIGSRICVIQVKDAGFFGEINANSSSVSFVNFQLWLYEGTNDIEFRYGNVDIQNLGDNLSNPSGFLCGLAEQINLNTVANVSSNVLNGPSANPTMTSISTALNEVVTGTVQSGRVYKFSRATPPPTNTVSISQYAVESQFNLYPNPASKTLYYKGNTSELKNAEINFYSFDGRLVLSKKVEQETDISEMVRGVYFVNIQSVNGELLYSGKLAVVD